MSQLKRRALQVSCMVGVVLGVCGCATEQPTAYAPSEGAPQRDPRMDAPRSWSMGAGDSMGQHMFGHSTQQVASVQDGAE